MQAKNIRALWCQWPGNPPFCCIVTVYEWLALVYSMPAEIIITVTSVNKTSLSAVLRHTAKMAYTVVSRPHEHFFTRLYPRTLLPPLYNYSPKGFKKKRGLDFIRLETKTFVLEFPMLPRANTYPLSITTATEEKIKARLAVVAGCLKCAHFSQRSLKLKNNF